MKISELIKALQDEQGKHGDVEVNTFFEGCTDDTINLHFEEGSTKDYPHIGTLFIGERWYSM
jgi:hypothetical protein